MTSCGLSRKRPARHESFSRASRVARMVSSTAYTCSRLSSDRTHSKKTKKRPRSPPWTHASRKKYRYPGPTIFLQPILHPKLTTHPRTIKARHQTQYSAMDWSCLNTASGEWMQPSGARRRLKSSGNSCRDSMASAWTHSLCIVLSRILWHQKRQKQ
eukprot:TRINITY_DN5557_c0_g1::TRINITY_DN5557_c0_g1_i1::g.9401::m.9401 TRINITY_DN5557_c0_g1::TRINITY_DN5557_c0_g1_i1::g.9401  ORF type:complete len:157 (+),score=-26.65,Nt_Gln_amidase/PF09764.4/0.49,Nt_Gln_amidase/PF09764.4/8.4 TRINITY_DN5557_c0_g1_i1:629-1099(+)